MSLTGHEPTPPYIDEVNELIAILQGRSYKSFKFITKYYENENHFSSWPKAFHEGLMSLYA